jgi:hypothetical protein
MCSYVSYICMMKLCHQFLAQFEFLRTNGKLYLLLQCFVQRSIVGTACMHVLKGYGYSQWYAFKRFMRAVIDQVRNSRC